jgi:hypothetical protein
MAVFAPAPGQLDEVFQAVASKILTTLPMETLR